MEEIQRESKTEKISIADLLDKLILGIGSIMLIGIGAYGLLILLMQLVKGK